MSTVISLLSGRLTRAFSKNHGFWLVATVLALITIPHYCGGSCYPPFALDLLSELGLARDSFERVLYLAPVVWSGFLFGWRGVLITSGAALACMLPAAVISDDPASGLVQIAAVLAVGTGISLAFVALRKQRDDYRAALSELEQAHRLLQQYSQVARANENRLVVLNAISATLGESIELEKVLHKALHLVTELMEVEVALIYSLDKEKQEFALMAYEGVSDVFARAVGRLPATSGLYGQVVRTGQPRTMEQASADPCFARPEAAKMKIENQLIVPLTFKGETKGVVSVAMRRPRTYTPSEIEMLSAVATQIGSAIYNASLYEETRMANDRLAESETNFRILLQHASDAVWMHDLEGNIIFANMAAERLTGYTQEEMRTMKLDDLLSEEERIAAAEVRRRMFEDDTVAQPYEQRITTKDGTQAVLRVTTNLLKYGGKLVAFGNVARDLTEEKLVQDDASLYLQQVYRAQEEEWSRMVEGLESGTMKNLAALASEINDFISTSGRLDPRYEVFLDRVRQRLADALADMQCMSGKLRTYCSRDLVLIPTLRWLLSEVDRLCGIKGELKVTGAVRRLPAYIELATFRVVQEGLKRVESGLSSSVAVVMNYGEDALWIRISDDAWADDLVAGLEDQHRASERFHGRLRELVRELGGKIDVEYEFGRGTDLVVRLPVQESMSH